MSGMTRRMVSVAGVGALAVCAAAMHGWAAAADGVLIAQKVTTGTDVRTTQMQMDKNHMRAEVSGANGAKQVVVFDGTRQVLLVIDSDKKTYNEITKADIDKLGAQMGDAMSQMQSQLANLPPAQR